MFLSSKNEEIICLVMGLKLDKVLSGDVFDSIIEEIEVDKLSGDNMFLIKKVFSRLLDSDNKDKEIENINSFGEYENGINIKIVESDIKDIIDIMENELSIKVYSSKEDKKIIKRNVLDLLFCNIELMNEDSKNISVDFLRDCKYLKDIIIKIDNMENVRLEFKEFISIDNWIVREVKFDKIK